jgi:hypothetical protein
VTAKNAAKRMAVLAGNGMQQIPVEMFGNRSALILDFDRDGGAAQASQISRSLRLNS